MDVEVADNPDKARFEILADGELAGFLQYHLRDGVIAFNSGPGPLFRISSPGGQPSSLAPLPVGVTDPAEVF